MEKHTRQDIAGFIAAKADIVRAFYDVAERISRVSSEDDRNRMQILTTEFNCLKDIAARADHSGRREIDSALQSVAAVDCIDMKSVH